MYIDNSINKDLYKKERCLILVKKKIRYIEIRCFLIAWFTRMSSEIASIQHQSSLRLRSCFLHLDPNHLCKFFNSFFYSFLINPISFVPPSPLLNWTRSQSLQIRLSSDRFHHFSGFVVPFSLSLFLERCVTMWC